MSAAAIASAVKQATQYVVEVGSAFEASMSEVQAISGATGAELEKMSAKAKQLGSTTKFSATEASQAFKYMALAGWDTNKSISAVDGVLQLAAASGMDLAAASDMVTDYLSAFGMERVRRLIWPICWHMHSLIPIRPQSSLVRHIRIVPPI